MSIYAPNIKATANRHSHTLRTTESCRNLYGIYHIEMSIKAQAIIVNIIFVLFIFHFAVLKFP